jgi:hypothetical protein
MTNDELIRRLLKRIPNSVTPLTRIEIHPSELITLLDLVGDLSRMSISDEDIPRLESFSPAQMQALVAHQPGKLHVTIGRKSYFYQVCAYSECLKPFWGGSPTAAARRPRCCSRVCQNALSRVLKNARQRRWMKNQQQAEKNER